MDRGEINSFVNSINTFSDTSSKLKSAGLIIPEKPVDAVQNVNLFTEWNKMKARYGGIAKIPFSELGDFLDRWTAFISYTRWVEAVADLEQQTALELRDTVFEQLYTLEEGNREIRHASVCTEPDYLKLEKSYLEKVALFKAIKGLREGYETRANAISREISRRSASEEEIRRSINRGGM